MTNIIILGPPGSGKGTQSKILVEKQNFFQISTGELLRKTVESGSEEGNKIQKIMECGELVPDKMVIEMILSEMSTSNSKKFIFDGFPRNITQAKALDGAFEEKSMILDFVILLDVKFDFLENRIKSRIAESDPSNIRKDDNLETLNKRLSVYKEITSPIINFYEKKDKLVRINGMDSIDGVTNKIIQIIN
tara:strand:+ start:2173 stop:2745 length:573 start_codon:yes stop_codon:yes gene_type:complete